MKNPWGLTDREAEVIDMLCATGCNKIVARRMNVSAGTVSQMVTRACMRMRTKNRVLVLLEWDRWKRAGAPVPTGGELMQWSPI